MMQHNSVEGISKKKCVDIELIETATKKKTYLELADKAFIIVSTICPLDKSSFILLHFHIAHMALMF